MLVYKPSCHASIFLVELWHQAPQKDLKTNLVLIQEQLPIQCSSPGWALFGSPAPESRSPSTYTIGVLDSRNRGSTLEIPICRGRDNCQFDFEVYLRSDAVVMLGTWITILFEFYRPLQYRITGFVLHVGSCQGSRDAGSSNITHTPPAALDAQRQLSNVWSY